MLSKNRRISRKEFPYILAKGKRYNFPHFLLYVAPINSIDKKNSSRFSFSISKKVFSKAVDRNKYRRRGYSVIDLYKDSLKPGYFCFFSFKKGSSGITFDTLQKEILGLLSASAVIS